MEAAPPLLLLLRLLAASVLRCEPGSAGGECCGKGRGGGGSGGRGSFCPFCWRSLEKLPQNSAGERRAHGRDGQSGLPGGGCGRAGRRRVACPHSPAPPGPGCGGPRRTQRPPVPSSQGRFPRGPGCGGGLSVAASGRKRETKVVCASPPAPPSPRRVSAVPDFCGVWRRWCRVSLTGGI